MMTEATLLSPDKRVLFPERIEAVVRLRHCDVQTAISEAMAGTQRGSPTAFCLPPNITLRSATAVTAQQVM